MHTPWNLEAELQEITVSTINTELARQHAFLDLCLPASNVMHSVHVRVGTALAVLQFCRGDQEVTFPC